MLLFGASFYVLPNSLLGKTKEKDVFLCFSLAYSYLCNHEIGVLAFPAEGVKPPRRAVPSATAFSALIARQTNNSSCIKSKELTIWETRRYTVVRS
jgi:hypothetical protein